MNRRQLIGAALGAGLISKREMAAQEQVAKATRATPSPTDRTCPTSLTSASAPKFWISRFRIAEISAG